VSASRLAPGATTGHYALVPSIGPCSTCGQPIEVGASFIDIGPTDYSDPDTPRRVRWVPVDEDIHGWTPFEIQHPRCFAQTVSLEQLVAAVDESHRLMRHRLAR
jgi:hypothetical protein